MKLVDLTESKRALRMRCVQRLSCPFVSQTWTSAPTGPTCAATTPTVSTPWARTAAPARTASPGTASTAQVAHTAAALSRSPRDGRVFDGGVVQMSPQTATSVQTMETCVEMDTV